MARPSAASLATVTKLVPKARRAPADLTPAQAVIWAEIVGSMPPGHFTAADETLLRTFVQVTEQLRRAQTKIGRSALVKGKLSPWFTVFDKAMRMQAHLARSLRIAASSRIDPETAGRRVRKGAATGVQAPWADD